jgi:hypothetical protein
MTAEAEISTPVETVTEETSTIVEPTEVETPTVEPDVTEEAAEVQAEVTDEVKEPQTVYAGKYNSIEALEKGYKELESKLGQPNEYEQKYNELLKAQQEAERKAQEERVRQAQQYGFKTVEDQEAHEKLQATELEWYANYLNLVAPENYENAKAYLGEYLRTGQVAYFNEAKKLFPLDFVENVANAKTQLSARLQGEIAQKRQLEREQFDKNLAEQIKGQFNEFLADSATNQAKANALKAMCDAGAINSVEDMQNFVNLYTSIVDNAKEIAIKEYEAAKAIEETKRKAVIDAGVTADSNSDNPPTYAQIEKMTQDEFNKACEKWGTDKIINAK